MRKRGFSIAEVVVALMIISVGLIAAARINPTSYRGAAVTKNRLNAMRIARNVVERVRSMPFARPQEAAGTANNQELAQLTTQIASLQIAGLTAQQQLTMSISDLALANPSGAVSNSNSGRITVGEAVASVSRSVSAIGPTLGQIGFSGPTAQALQQKAAEIQQVAAQAANQPTAHADSVNQLFDLQRQLSKLFTAGLQELEQKKQSLANQQRSSAPVSGTIELDPKQFQPAVPPELSEGNRVGAEFKVTRVAVSIPGEIANAGTVTVTVEWNDVAGKEKDDSKSLTITGGLVREP